jgi:hypothetical protein
MVNSIHVAVWGESAEVTVPEPYLPSKNPAIPFLCEQYWTALPQA